MSNGIHQTNENLVDNYEDFRFRDAAEAIYMKYHRTGMIKSSEQTTEILKNVYRGNQHETIVHSKACTIL